METSYRRKKLFDDSDEENDAAENQEYNPTQETVPVIHTVEEEEYSPYTA